MGTIHVTFGAFKDVRSQVMANRGPMPMELLQIDRLMFL